MRACAGRKRKVWRRSSNTCAEPHLATMPRSPTLDDLRRNSVRHTLFAPTTLMPAIQRLGFVQADPIRAPARAQDLTLRHRVRDYRAGDLERHYPRLDLEEDYFVNHGFLPRATQRLMHPRTPRTVWSAARWRQAHEVLAFVRERGTVHPREVDAHFDHGRVRNWFGGSTTRRHALPRLAAHRRARERRADVRRGPGPRSTQRSPRGDRSAGRHRRGPVRTLARTQLGRARLALGGRCAAVAGAARAQPGACQEPLA
jgi:hypothetical protein